MNWFEGPAVIRKYCELIWRIGSYTVVLRIDLIFFVCFVCVGVLSFLLLFCSWTWAIGNCPSCSQGNPIGQGTELTWCHRQCDKFWALLLWCKILSMTRIIMCFFLCFRSWRCNPGLNLCAVCPCTVLSILRLVASTLWSIHWKFLLWFSGFHVCVCVCMAMCLWVCNCVCVCD